MLHTFNLRRPIVIFGHQIGIDGYSIEVESNFIPTNNRDYPFLISGKSQGLTNTFLEKLRSQPNVEFFVYARRYLLSSVAHDGTFTLLRAW